MEEIDPSNFSGLGKAIFSGIISSEAAMRNLNTEEEKKSKIEHENQEINKKIKETMRKATSDLNQTLWKAKLGWKLAVMKKSD